MTQNNPNLDPLDSFNQQAEFMDKFADLVDAQLETFNPLSYSSKLSEDNIPHHLPLGLDTAPWPIDLNKLAPAPKGSEKAEIKTKVTEWSEVKDSVTFEEAPKDTPDQELSDADKASTVSMTDIMSALVKARSPLSDIPDSPAASIRRDTAPKAEEKVVTPDKITVPKDEKKRSEAKHSETQKKSKRKGKRRKPKSEMPKDVKVTTAEDLDAKVKEREKKLKDLLDDKKGNISTDAI